MIRPRVVLALFRKDAIDAIRESRVLVSLLTPILLAVLYNTLFPEDRLFEAKVAYVGPSNSAVIATLESRAKENVDLRLRQVSTIDEARTLVASQDVDVAFVLPPDVDAAIAAGRAPTIVVIQPEVPSAGASFVTESIEAAGRVLSGQKPPVVVAPERVKAGSADQGVMGDIGPRRYFVLATVVMMLGMIALLAVPIILTEEAERKTLDALLLVGSYIEVIVAKALVGILYTVLSVTIMLVLTRLRPGDLVTFVAGTGLLAVALIGVGLLMAGLFKTANQVYTWSSVLLMPVVGPAFIVGLPVPGALDAVLRALPTSQAMRAMTNGLAGQALFSDVWLSYVVTAAWALGAYALLAWRLSRRES